MPSYTIQGVAYSTPLIRSSKHLPVNPTHTNRTQGCMRNCAAAKKTSRYAKVLEQKLKRSHFQKHAKITFQVDAWKSVHKNTSCCTIMQNLLARGMQLISQ
jgi:hypothetical protein